MAKLFYANDLRNYAHIFQSAADENETKKVKVKQITRSSGLEED